MVTWRHVSPDQQEAGLLNAGKALLALSGRPRRARGAGGTSAVGRPPSAVIQRRL